MLSKDGLGMASNWQSNGSESGSQETNHETPQYFSQSKKSWVSSCSREAIRSRWTQEFGPTGLGGRVWMMLTVWVGGWEEGAVKERDIKDDF